jgi:hypothetical protein
LFRFSCSELCLAFNIPYVFSSPVTHHVLLEEDKDTVTTFRSRHIIIAMASMIRLDGGHELYEEGIAEDGSCVYDARLPSNKLSSNGWLRTI